MLDRRRPHGRIQRRGVFQPLAKVKRMNDEDINEYTPTEYRCGNCFAAVPILGAEYCGELCAWKAREFWKAVREVEHGA